MDPYVCGSHPDPGTSRPVNIFLYIWAYGRLKGTGRGGGEGVLGVSWE